jgi:vitamin K-dependent gamma-carboxylase-like protein
VTAIDRWLFAPAPARRLAVLRILVGGYAVVFLLARWPSFWTAPGLPARQFEPVGPLWWMDGPVDPALARGTLIAVVLLGLLFVAGVGWRVVGPLFALGFFVVAAYRVSWGHVIHSEHLPALHLLVVGFAPAADAWRVEWHRRGATSDEPPRPHARYGWPIRVMVIILIVTYLLAGWMKLRNGGSDWVDGRVLRNQIAYDNLRKELLGSQHSPIGGWLVRYDWPFPPMAWATMAIELGAPLALLGRRLRTVWAIGAWGFHIGIVVLMAISFPYQVAGIAYLCLFAPERAVERATSWWQTRTEKEASKSPDRAAAVSRT